jgi:hypothetical protein
MRGDEMKALQKIIPSLTHLIPVEEGAKPKPISR